MNSDQSGKCMWEVIAENVVNDMHEAIFLGKYVFLAKNKHVT